MTAGVVGLSLILGGGTGHGLWSDAAVQIASLLLLAMLAGRARLSEWRKIKVWPLILLAAVILLPLLQLIRMLPSLWTTLPGRAMIEQEFAEAGVALPWLPISLDPGATWRSAISLLPAAAVFLATFQLDLHARRSLSLVFLALGIASVLLGLGQLMQGPESPLRLFPVTNNLDSVGFFANRNHYAALLYCLIPITAAWIVGLSMDRHPRHFLILAVYALIFVILILGLGMARSRAGLFLAALAVAGSLWMAKVNGERQANRGPLIIAAGTLIGLIMILQYAFFGIAGRLEADVLTDIRFQLVSTTANAAQSFQPIGSGFGTFAQIYQAFETTDTLLLAYANHAHNDYLELWLEGGWLAIALVIAFLAWFVVASLGAWRGPLKQAGVLDRALAQAGSLVVLLLLVHSAMDYPLRTTALAVLFGWSCALLILPAKQPSALESQKDTTQFNRWQVRSRRSSTHSRIRMGKQPETGRLTAS